MEDILTHCLKPSLEHISIVYSCLLIDASDNMCNALYFAQVTKIETDKFSIVYSIFLSNFHLSSKKPVNVFFGGAISLKTTSITLRHLDI